MLLVGLQIAALAVALGQPGVASWFRFRVWLRVWIPGDCLTLASPANLAALAAPAAALLAPPAAAAASTLAAGAPAALLAPATAFSWPGTARRRAFVQVKGQQARAGKHCRQCRLTHEPQDAAALAGFPTQPPGQGIEVRFVHWVHLQATAGIPAARSDQNRVLIQASGIATCAIGIVHREEAPIAY